LIPNGSIRFWHKPELPLPVIFTGKTAPAGTKGEQKK